VVPQSYLIVGLDALERPRRRIFRMLLRPDLDSKVPEVSSIVPPTTYAGESDDSVRIGAKYSHPGEVVNR
jgi:hypothetical protein